MSTDALAELGNAAVREITRELEMQAQNSLSIVYNEAQRFVPPGIGSAERNNWMLGSLHSLGVQILRSRYHLDDKQVKAAERAIRRANKGTRHEGCALADVLDGDLDGNPDLKVEYVNQVVNLLDDAVGQEDGMMIRIMDALGGIGMASDEVRRLLSSSQNNTAAIIQDRASNTLWKLCIEAN